MKLPAWFGSPGSLRARRNALLALAAVTAGPALTTGPAPIGPALIGPALADPAGLPAPLSTRGNQIVAGDGTAVRLAGVGVFTDVSGDVARIRDAGFNTLRISWGNRHMAADLARIDRILTAAARVGLRAILDNHYNEGIAGMCVAQQKNGLWYDLGGASDGTDGCGTPGTVTDAKFLADWQAVAQRYGGNPAVIGYDLRNEPLAYRGMTTWEPGSRDPDHNLRWMYERVGSAIQAIDPDKLIICEGPQNYRRSFAGRGPAPWGDLTLAARLPVTLPVPNKLVYSVHDYPAAIGAFHPDSGPEKVAQMNRTWGFLVLDNLAVVLVGEMAGNMRTPEDTAWADTLTGYMDGTAPGGPRFTPPAQPLSGIWWWAGSDDNAGDQPTGIWDAAGRLRPEQQAVWRRLLPRP
jgi:endoglucanase